MVIKRVQFRLDSATKNLAEEQAAILGYSSLAAFLKVAAANLAGDWRQARGLGPSPVSPADKPAAGAEEWEQEEREVLPPPEQFSTWPVFFSPEMADKDPMLYKLLIETGHIS